MHILHKKASDAEKWACFSVCLTGVCCFRQSESTSMSGNEVVCMQGYLDSLFSSCQYFELDFFVLLYLNLLKVFVILLYVCYFLMFV